MKSFTVLPLAGVVLVLFAGSGAQITQRASVNHQATPRDGPPPAVSAAEGPTYTVKFDTDGLDATVEDGTIPRIVVRPVHGFGQLARPRLHFVPELLKSVEVM